MRPLIQAHLSAVAITMAGSLRSCTLVPIVTLGSSSSLSGAT
ncbi:hypothetical protein [Nonomuraea dietziae]